MVMVPQYCEYTQNHWIRHLILLEMVNFMLCLFNLINNNKAHADDRIYFCKINQCWFALYDKWENCSNKAFQPPSLCAQLQDCSAAMFWTYSMVQPIITPIAHWPSCHVAWRSCSSLLQVLVGLARLPVSTWSNSIDHLPHPRRLAWASCPSLPVFPNTSFYQWVSCLLSLKWKC